MKAPGLKCIKAFLIGSGGEYLSEKNLKLCDMHLRKLNVLQGAYQIYHKTVDFVLNE